MTENEMKPFKKHASPFVQKSKMQHITKTQNALLVKFSKNS